MSRRARPIRNLYFRWGRAAGLDSTDCAARLESAGLIELTPDRRYYTETKKMRSIPPYDFDRTVMETLTATERQEDNHGNK